MLQIDTEEVEFRLAGGSNPLILVPTYVNGEGPYEFILDTGAGSCLISSELATRLEVRAESEKDAHGAGGILKIGLAHVSSIAVGSARQENVEVAITGELERVGRAIGAKLDGDIGYTFMKDFRVILDYKRRRMRFEAAPAATRGSRMRGARTSFALAGESKPLILVKVLVDGDGPFQFALDTGASRTILGQDVARRLNLRTEGATTGTGAGGGIEVITAKVRSFAVGDACVASHEVAIGAFVETISTAANAKIEGIVGYNFLNQFQVTIDYPRAEIEFVRA